MVKEVLIGYDLIDHIKEYEVILVGTGINNNKGNGFQKKIFLSFPEVDRINKETNYNDVKKLGTCQVVSSYVKDGFPIFVLCYITKGRYRPDIIPDALDYDALKSCLELVNEHFKGKKVATTLIGNSIFEGGGNDKKIYSIIADTTDDIELTIYDYIQEDYYKETRRKVKEIYDSHKLGKLTKEEFEKTLCNFWWERNFGKYLSKPPENVPRKKLLKEISKIKQK